MLYGDENTKFFHAMATESYRRNTIASLISEDGRMVTNHEVKAAIIIWNSFYIENGCHSQLRDALPSRLVGQSESRQRGAGSYPHYPFHPGRDRCNNQGHAE